MGFESFTPPREADPEAARVAVEVSGMGIGAPDASLYERGPVELKELGQNELFLAIDRAGGLMAEDLALLDPEWLSSVYHEINDAIDADPKRPHLTTEARAAIYARIVDELKRAVG